MNWFIAWGIVLVLFGGLVTTIAATIIGPSELSLQEDFEITRNIPTDVQEAAVYFPIGLVIMFIGAASTTYGLFGVDR